MLKEYATGCYENTDIFKAAQSPDWFYVHLGIRTESCRAFRLFILQLFLVLNFKLEQHWQRKVFIKQAKVKGFLVQSPPSYSTVRMFIFKEVHVALWQMLSLPTLRNHWQDTLSWARCTDILSLCEKQLLHLPFVLSLLLLCFMKIASAGLSLSTFLINRVRGFWVTQLRDVTCG